MERTSTLMVLSEKNLSDYRAWLKDIREKVRAEKGRLTEAHLIGELVTEQDATSLDVNVSYQLRFRGFALNIGIFGQNLNDDSQALDGISIFDKRVYLSMGLVWK